MTATVVLADTSVLFSRVLCDYAMYAGLEGIIRLRWSDSILDELERTLAERHKTTSAQARRLRGLMNSALPDALVTPTASDAEQVAHLALPDEADRHVLAAALAADANLLCTTNLRDFPLAATKAIGVEAASPDELLHAPATAFPAEMIDIHRTVVAQMPHTTDENTLTALRRAGAPRTASTLLAMLSRR
ncbi:PIN domain-containing protein [Gulosibacter sp. 10]|uniref:PIN domain-containing protein n=1 Tax=Gulosibacter sp. 10 TaxID=1255570 RepID=UPI00097EE518|nr:PIN domain-containing protein [Gulosibacter sp. 10]SJM71544.1 hypothetical protein FM112_16450 [Gulosibacter sp. 10]